MHSEVDVPALSLPPRSSCGSLDGGDDVIVSIGTLHHLGKVLVTVAGDSKDEPGYTLIALLGAYSLRAILFFFLSTSPQYTCSSLEDDVVVHLPLVNGPTDVTGSKCDGEQSCFYFQLRKGA